MQSCPQIGYFQNTVAGIKVCSECHSSCLTCNGTLDANCLSCNSNHSLFLQVTGLGEIYCLGECSTGFYKNYTDNTCRKCHPYCSKCTGWGNAGVCQACETDYFYMEPYSKCDTQ